MLSWKPFDGFLRLDFQIKIFCWLICVVWSSLNFRFFLFCFLVVLPPIMIVIDLSNLFLIMILSLSAALRWIKTHKHTRLSLLRVELSSFYEHDFSVSVTCSGRLISIWSLYFSCKTVEKLVVQTRGFCSDTAQENLKPQAAGHLCLGRR